MREILNILALYFATAAPVIAKKQFRPDYTYYEEVSGWFKFHAIPAIWLDAELRCHLEGAALASPWNQAMKNIMIMIMNSEKTDIGYTPTTIHTGIHAYYSEGDYRTVEGQRLHDTQYAWEKFQPNNLNNNQTCVEMYTGGTLNDKSCYSHLNTYICFAKHRPNMFITKCGSFGYQFKPETGHCYKFHSTLAIWSMAHMTCEAERARLVIINSQEESKILKRMYDDYKRGRPAMQVSAYAHIGFRTRRHFILWRTIEGQTLKAAGFSTFAKGEPNNPFKEFCGSIDADGLLNDISCIMLAPFICELTPSI